MSHVVRIQTKVRDRAAVTAACARLRISPPEAGEFNLYTSRAAGFAVRLTGWRYPLLCQSETGELAYDNFGGVWGDQAQLDEFLQAEKTRIESRKQGYTVTEQPLADGAVKLTVHAGGMP